MSLYDSILIEIRNGQLPQVISATDLTTEKRKVTVGENEKYRVGFEFYAKNNLTTELANRAEDGYWTKKGQLAKYVRTGKGKYLVLGLNEDEELFDTENPQDSEVEHADAYAGLPLEERFSHYLRIEKFQIYNKRKKALYPTKPAVGVQPRLELYFWPSEKNSYSNSKSLFDSFIASAKKVDLDKPAQELVELFERICEWGGVKLPSNNPEIIAKNIIDAGNDVEAQVNSAWTKLYAVFYPDQFVIFDSRVATALVSMAEKTMGDVELSNFKLDYPGLGTVVGRGGTRPRATLSYWPNAYRRWQAQLDANRLVLKILDALQKKGEKITLRELEAVLFMEGY